MEYEERESEFDVEDEDRSVDQTGESLHDEEVEVNNKIGLGFPVSWTPILWRNRHGSGGNPCL